MAQFHALTVTDVRKTIKDAVVVSFAAPEDGSYDFVQGQYLTFRHKFEGDELRRSYSICAGRDEGILQVGIKRVEGGAFSTWANDSLKPGDTLEAMPPMGNFHTPLDAATRRHYLGFAGGSGITPVLSILKTVLTQEPQSRFTLVYANRAVNSIMFRDELEDLKNTYMGRVNVIHVLETDAQDIDLFTGRVDAEKCARLFSSWIDIASIDTAFICGPEPMMLGIAKSLKDHGLDDAQIKFELFGASQPGRAKHRAKIADAGQANTMTQVSVTIDGATRQFEMSKDTCLLDAALENSIDAPFACKAGVCSSCRAKVTEGEVEMLTNHALEDYEVAAGFVLTCQCYPLGDKVVFDYDQ
ncbi:phenylacetate-CoA oxygenase/reductase subunit PaaK [Sulfitobacter sp. SK012]|uniref:1,2-phenylacetyl-CoA epoxidase subunit PaaE n=1 Tax=Sulfitobacter sp. SK012 TaxID=1389005 RepID=UPI000E0B0D70|nr:1,2-phenylacetyl-CoA epoxidase subunit PaaE [Sulfitobacter sp. SK012]AXI46965.1 phenylacetate-CoA oxygenase/reductase subunit PaaK [Sulfitobacter sp. SK012]